MTKGDRDRFETFVRTSRRAMLRIAQNLCRTSGVDAEDLVEETLERVVRKLEHGPGADPLALPFVATVMTHRYIDLCRRRRAEGVIPEPAAPEAEGEGAAVPGPEPMERWRSVPDAQLGEAMAALRPERIREVYRLHAAGFRYRQIAERLGLPEGTVGSDLSEARQQLRRRLRGRVE